MALICLYSYIGLLANHTAHDYGHQPLPDRGEETDMESGSNCTGKHEGREQVQVGTFSRPMVDY